MWIFCGGMFRSGSTVQYQIASHLVEQAGLGRRVTWHSPDAFVEVRDRQRSDPGLLVFKAHGLTAAMRGEVEAHGARVVTVHRDIRDVVVSAMRKNSWSFRHVWRSGKLRWWTRRFDEWAAMPGALVSRYDRLVADLAGEAGRIGRLLGIDVAPALAATIAAEYAIDRQRERTAAVCDRRERGELAVKYDPHSLLHHNHVACGGVGMYRGVLAPAEVRAIEDECGAWMAHWGYSVDDPDLGIGQRLHRWSLGRAA